MDINDRDNLKEFLVELYGPQARRWSMNENVFKIVYKMINESSACSDLMDLVPRPHALGKAPIKYITKEIRTSVIRKLKARKEHYKSCMQVVAASYKTQIHMTSIGI
jgi:hypothetical protein